MSLTINMLRIAFSSNNATNHLKLDQQTTNPQSKKEAETSTKHPK